ncbi:MAG: PD-(D/E)XK nuclease family protein, partial [Bacteroidaceae bacterium]|nr:PD-(D/E)XK nuclease family protein [Bacteroidaceae bacterium]
MDIKADDYFAELEDLFNRTNDVDIAEIYDIFSHIFTRIADDCTRELKILFSGQFAKVDYLLKQNNISSELSYRIHDLRIRLKDTTKFNQNQLIELCPHDLQTLCEFIASIFSAHIPAELQKHFPLVTRKISGRKLAAEYFRIVVSGWDSTYIYGTAEYNDLNEVKICYNFSDKYSLGDWTYIEPMLSEGCQLNIVKPRIANEIYYPELIIFEPDYLIDISQIAACFESYGHSPEQYLLNKIKLYPNTKYILLGNLAGQFLDEEIHNLDKDVRYEDSINRFFKKNAINFATCCELDGSFHEEARRQQQYIRNTVRNALKESVKTFDIEKVLLEPSFFSEELGIQGRMDLLLNDNTVLIEQKSGKANTFSSDSDVPQPQEKHLVQLLLYMALIHYNYGLRNENIYAFLLYSKYAKSLVKCSPAPKELFEAFKLRNEIVANELSYPQGTMSQLLDITPDSLNIKCNYGFFWERYQEPQIQEVLAPLHNAISLEQKYYLQFMKFIATEHILSKIGNRQQPASGFAALWNSSLAEKHLAGNIYDSLSICNKKTGDDGITTITLKIPESDTFDNPNFRVGDVVILYRYNSTEIPDARKTMVHRASIEDITNEEITLLLRAAQRNESVFDTPKNYKWAIEHDFIDSSYNAQYKAMQMFLLTTEDRRDLILAQRMPEVDKSVSLNNDYGNDDFNTLVLKAKQAKDYFIIIGPPGAGKTSYGMLNVLKEELSEPDGTVLVVSFTNRAVDEVCSKLVENNIGFMRIGTKLSCAKEYRPFL